MTTLLLVLNLLQAAPALFQTETRPFEKVASVELVAELEKYADRDESALVAFQVEAKHAMQVELSKRTYEVRN